MPDIDRTKEIEQLARDAHECDVTMADAVGMATVSCGQLTAEQQEEWRDDARERLAKLPSDLPMEARVICSQYGECNALCDEPCNTMRPK